MEFTLRQNNGHNNSCFRFSKCGLGLIYILWVITWRTIIGEKIILLAINEVYNPYNHGPSVICTCKLSVVRILDSCLIPLVHIYIYICIYIYIVYMWQMSSVFSHESAQRNDAGHLICENVFKTTRPCCYQWFRVSTRQAMLQNTVQ